MRPSEWARERVATWNQQLHAAIRNPDAVKIVEAVHKAEEAAVIAAYLEELEAKG